MAKKKIKRSRTPAYEEDRVMRELQHMKHKDLQKACILRGLSSKEMLDMDHHRLVGWFYKHYDNTQDPNNLIIHDEYVEAELERRGYKKGVSFRAPSLRMSYTPDLAGVTKIADIKPDTNVPRVDKKPKAEVDEETGVRKGTKKALTYELTTAKKDIAEIIKGVKERFPDAEEKSIKIWHKRCLKALKEKV